MHGIMGRQAGGPWAQRTHRMTPISYSHRVTCALISSMLLLPRIVLAQDATLPLRTEFLMALSLNLEEPQQVGDTPAGNRRVVPVSGGAFAGPRVKGTVLQGGSDWPVTRRDGVSRIDARITLRTDDGSLIFVSYPGIYDIQPEVRDRIA